MSPQSSVRIDFVIALRCTVIYVEKLAIKISASETGRKALQNTYHLLRSTGDHKGRMNRANGNGKRGLWHGNGRTGRSASYQIPLVGPDFNSSPPSLDAAKEQRKNRRQGAALTDETDCCR